MAGTVFNMAPEMLRKENSNEKVDVGVDVEASSVVPLVAFICA